MKLQEAIEIAKILTDSHYNDLSQMETEALQILIAHVESQSLTKEEEEVLAKIELPLKSGNVTIFDSHGREIIKKKQFHNTVHPYEVVLMQMIAKAFNSTYSQKGEE